MVDIKGTPIRQDFPEVQDKIVSSVEVVIDTEGFGITIRFHDETTLYFDIESHIVVTPISRNGNKGKRLR